MVGRVAAMRALDGLGHPVAWWAVLKLPSHVQSPDGNQPVVPTPCDCVVPDCSNVATAGWPALEARSTGLCYLYADSRTPEFRHFRELGYDCLGQGGNDPVSQTLKQKDQEDSYWAIFNDQLNGIAGAYHPNGTTNVENGKQVCGGGDAFSAHAKGAVAFESEGGGFFLQTSTPNFPDPTRNDSFVRLGCQSDNNVQFAQHMLAMSLGDSELMKLGKKLQLARLCSGNFFQNGSLHELLGSANMFEDGQKQENTTAAAFYHALLDPNLPMQNSSDPMKTEFSLKLSAENMKSRIFEPLDEDQSLTDLVEPVDKEEILVLVKSPRAAVPPWALVAEMLDSDMSVASWWDGSYGIPTICAGDVFSNAPHEFCLNDPLTGVELNADGSAPYNIENLMRATWQMNNGSTNLTWQLVGGRVLDGNHAKWGLTTPRSGQANISNSYVIFGDLNMEGFPCSKTCNGSQAAQMPHLSGQKDLRMCHRGCVKKIEEHLEPTQLPILSSNASSFWST
ncbi:putative extracellular protein [Phytophthora megakarya]|uniref:Putative extracellular protein n=1 Tax=Phytophthora megakarya TaxID=4795 RepID=A0A225W8G7_9STRA|nr:putative extracellular protein [Phytophthora megakarya]